MNHTPSSPLQSPLPSTPPGIPAWRPSWAVMGPSRVSGHEAVWAELAEMWASRSLDVLDVEPMEEAS